MAALRRSSPPSRARGAARVRLWLLALVALIAPGLIATDAALASVTYYLSETGDDAAAGTSPDRAWRTLGRAGATQLQTGDRLLLAGGATFDGSLVPKLPRVPDPSRPVVISSYGDGRATIRAGRATGLYAADGGGIAVSRLRVVGAGAGVNTSSGVLVYSEGGGRDLRDVRVSDVEISGFRDWGLAVGTHLSDRGYEDVRISDVSAHHNGIGGILTFADRANLHRDVHVDGCAVFANPGRAGMTRNSGNGVVLGNVDGGSISGCRAYDNGGLNDASEGGVGIWAYDSRRLLIEGNESFSNRTGGPHDGGGFDLDHNVSESVVQHNLAYDNDGPGFLLYHGPDTAAHAGNVLRHNTSRNDGRRNGAGGIRVFGRNPDTLITGNTVEMAPPAHGTSAALELWTPHGGGYESVRISGNHFVTRGGAPLVESHGAASTTAAGLEWADNVLDAQAGFLVLWRGQALTDLAQWLGVSSRATTSVGGAAVPAPSAPSGPAPSPSPVPAATPGGAGSSSARPAPRVSVSRPAAKRCAGTRRTRRGCPTAKRPRTACAKRGRTKATRGRGKAACRKATAPKRAAARMT